MTRSLVSFSAATGLATLAVVGGNINSAQAATIDLSTGTASYSVTSPDGSTAPVSVEQNGGWTATAGTAQWIAPLGGANSAPVGDYVYSTIFNLAGLDAATASISGSWASDNVGSKISLNGTDFNFPSGGFSSTSTLFTIASGFAAGENTLSFYVNNASTTANPTGLLASAIVTANSVTAVPEPAEFMGTALAFGSIVALRRKMTKKAE